MKARFIPAQYRHIGLIESIMRPRDVAEIRAGWGRDPAEAMHEALVGSYFARTVMLGLEPLCMFGLAPLSVIGATARAWIFATAAIDRHPIAFARASKQGLAEVFARCNLATNLIDQNDAPARRWLEWLGGTYVLPPQVRGGRLFSQFILVDRSTKEQRQCQRG